MGRTENLTVNNTSVREVAATLPDVLSAWPHMRKTGIHTGSFDILKEKTGSETLKKDFLFLLEALRVPFISGPIPTLGRGCESFNRLLGLNTCLASAGHEQQIGFIDNFHIFWNVKGRFMPDRIHPNNIGSRHLGSNIRQALETASEHTCTDKQEGQGAEGQTDSFPTKTTISKDNNIMACNSKSHHGETPHLKYRKENVAAKKQTIYIYNQELKRAR